jgi:hypothetical protein
MYLSKTAAAGCLFKENSKKPKKSKNPKTQKQQPYCYTTSFSSFSNEQNCLLHSLNFICQYLFLILTMMYNIFDINATEVKTNIQCK